MRQQARLTSFLKYNTVFNNVNYNESCKVTDIRIEPLILETKVKVNTVYLASIPTREPIVIKIFQNVP